MKTGNNQLLVVWVLGPLFLLSCAQHAVIPARFDPLLKTNWYGLYMQGAKIGYFKMALEKVDRPVDGWKMQSFMSIKMKMAEQVMTMTTDDTRIFKSPGGELYTNSFEMESPTGSMTVDGKKAGDKYAVTSVIGGEKTDKDFGYPVDYLDSALCVEMHIATGKATVGDSFSFTSFDPTPPLTGLIHQTAVVKSQETYIFNGVPTDVFTLSLSLTEMNLTSDVVMDLFGTTLETTLGGQMEIKLEGEQQAKRLDDTFDILSNSLIIPNRPIDDPSRLKYLELRLTGIDSSAVLRTDMQEVNSGDGGVLLKISAQENPSNTLPRPVDSAELQPYLASDPLEQSDDPQIIKLAQKIIGPEKDSWAAARMINEWVYQNIQKRFTPDFSNALQTLNSRRGDCGEHTALAVALMRAAGIPARPVVGVIYWPPGDGFGYHAWTEVYVGKWVQMDPSWGETLANPAHVALARGDILAQVSVLHRVMGKMKIEVLNSE